MQTDRDERTLAVGNAGYRLAYVVLTFGLLAAVAYRAFAFGQASWDLLALVIGGGAISLGYQASHRALSPRVLRAAAISAIIGAVVAVIITLIA
jgi:hypothetical protein